MEVIRSLIEPRHRKNIDWVLLLCVVALMATSLLTIYTGMFGHKGHAVAFQLVVKQAVSYVTGLGLLGWLATRDYANFRRSTFIFYGITLFLLLVVLVIGKDDGSGAYTKGSARWVPLFWGFKLQPSELAKIALILTLSTLLTQLGPRIREFSALLKTLVYTGIPLLLILKQPDLGTGLVLCAIWLGMTFLAGADWRHLVLVMTAGIGLFALGWKLGIVKDYQKERVEVLFWSEEYKRKLPAKKRDKAYQMDQGVIAVGGGQVTGQGFRTGPQTSGGYVPENWTDFAFSTFAEQTGFVGCLGLLFVYLLLLWRGLLCLMESEDPLGRLITGGVITYLAFHVFVNIAMNCKIAPVVGVPLPLISYGGSAAWTNCAALGLLLSVRMRRRKLQF